MKKVFAMILAFTMISTALAGCAGKEKAVETTAAAKTEASEAAKIPETETVAETEAETEPADSPAVTKKDLGVGYVQVFDFGDVKLHAYKTNDAIDDECFLIESGTELVALEAPGFKDNISEYTEYIASLGKPLNNILLAYHPAGAETLSETAEYLATEGAKAAQQEGGSVRGLTEGFVESFGDSFDGTIPEVTEIIKPGTMTIGGIEFVISEGLDGFDVEIPEINCVFTHMVGADVHNIMPSVGAMDALAEQMQGYIDEDYTLILSSHYVPETIDAAETKLAYAKKMKELAEENSNAEDFTKAAKAAFPNYAGENYLEMTAAGLYQ